MNLTIKDATVKRYHYDSHEQLRSHLADVLDAYNVARRLKSLSGLTPYGYSCKIWTSELDRFTVDPIHQMPGLYSSFACLFFLAFLFWNAFGLDELVRRKPDS